jgi:hypothetical protein
MELNLSIEFFLDRLVFEPLGFRSQIESVSYNFLADQPRPVSWGMHELEILSFVMFFVSSVETESHLCEILNLVLESSCGGTCSFFVGSVEKTIS